MKKFQKWIFVLGVPLLFSPACYGHFVPNPDEMATISGAVSDPSGQPAAGVRVTVHPGQYPEMPDYAETQTDQNGRYEIVLHFKIPRAWQGVVGPKINCIMARDVGRNLAASLDFSGTPTNMDLKLQPGITLSGSVKDTKGWPVTNARVDLNFMSGGSVFRLAQQPIKVDAQGSFSITALPQGLDYYIPYGITAPGYGTASGSLHATDAHTNFYQFPAFVLKTPDRKLSGQVVDSENKPLGGVRVHFGGIGQPQRDYTTNTDGRGRFAVDGLCEGSLKIFAEYEGPRGTYMRLNGTTGIEVQAGDTNLVLQLDQPFHAPNSIGR